MGAGQALQGGGGQLRGDREGGGERCTGPVVNCRPGGNAQIVRMVKLRRHLIRKGILKGRQACKGAPLVIEAQALAAIKIGPRSRPVTSNQDQKTPQF